MSQQDDFMYPPGYTPNADHSESRIEDKRVELDRLRTEVVKAKEFIKSEYYKSQTAVWENSIKNIIGQYNPTSPTALSDAVFGMGMLRQIYNDMTRPQELINTYEKKQASYDKLVRAKGK
jgi:hypothetical protein